MGSPNFSVGQGQLKVINSNGSTYLVGNTGTGATADFNVRIAGIHTISVDNFIGLSSGAIVGTDAADVLKGTVYTDVMIGKGGNDKLNGGGARTP